MFKNIFIKSNSSPRCGCSSFNPSDIIEPKPKSSSSPSLDHHHQNQNQNPSHLKCHIPHQKSGRLMVPSTSSSPSSCEKENSTTSFSTSYSDHDLVCSKLRDSVAIVKESKDPFLDFRQSMLEMISEKEIYSKDELQELLDLFLKLNSACHHQIIVKAFMEIWKGVFSREACESIEFDRGKMHGGH